MSQNKNDDFKEVEGLEEDIIIPKDQYDPEDRLTTQDLTEIDNLINEMNLLNDSQEPTNIPKDYISGNEPLNTPDEKRNNIVDDKTEDLNIPLDSSNHINNEQTQDLGSGPKVLDKNKISQDKEEKPEEYEPESEDFIIDSKPIKETPQIQRESLKPEDNDEEEIPQNNKPKMAFARKGKNGKGPKRQKGLPRRVKRSSWKRSLAIFISVVAVLGVITVSGIYFLYTANFTDISDTRYTPKDKTYIYSADNVEIAAIFSENRKYVSIDQIPQDLKNALVAVEDSRFYTHGGVDYRGIIRAFLSNIIRGQSTGQGASTITQQLARLLYLPDISTESTFLDSLNRKFKEISIAFQMEEKYTKDQILEMYMNEYYFGSASYGVEAASETYFNKSVNELNLAESALLAGLPQAPSLYAPNVDFDLSKQRQYHVLQRMVANGYITQEQADEAYNTPITIAPWSESDINNQIQPQYQNFVGKVIDEYAKTVAPNIMKERGLSEEEAETYARQNISSGGFKIYTTIDTRFQNTAVNTMEDSLANFGFYQADGYTGALVSVDRDGAVRSYYGGNETYSAIDMADSPRQPGSNIKPLYYSLGIESGTFNPNSILNDTPININGYSPHNSDGGYSGAISFAQSLVQSKNVTSVQIFNTLGTATAVDWIKQFGFDSITDDDYNLATALGGLTYGVKPYQMAAAFNTFNNNGVYNQAYFITKITTSVGDTVIDKNTLGLASKQIMSPQTAATMWGLMNQVVTSGTGTNAQCGIITAGKTGTTDSRENLWFTGMTSNLTTSVWMGNLDYHVIGGNSGLPAAIYGSYLRNLIYEGLVS